MRLSWSWLGLFGPSSLRLASCVGARAGDAILTLSRHPRATGAPGLSRAARLLARSTVAAVCGAACADRDEAARHRSDEIGAGRAARSAEPSGSAAAGAGGATAGAGARVTAGGAAGTAAGSVGSAGTTARHACVDPEPLGDGTTVRCADGSVARVSAPTCAPPVLEGDPCTELGAAGRAGAGGQPLGCETSCDAAPYGRHRLTDGGAVILSHYVCDYLCATDDDCPKGSACVCPNVGGAGGCLPAECSASSDCAAGETCRLAQLAGSCGQGFPGLFCVGPNDECISSSDCPTNGTSSFPQQRCASPGLDHPLRCLDSGAAGCGRPILIDEAARVASLVRGVVWLPIG